MAQICVFDINGTLLDISGLDRTFEKVFGQMGLRKLWFPTMLHSSLVLTHAGRYEGLREIAAHTLSAMALAEGITPEAEEVYEILKGMETLPLFPDVQEGLARFRAHGFRLVALTDSALTCTQEQLDRFNIRHHFEKVFSADAVQASKPDRRPYELVAAELGVAPKDLWMVTGHAWDATGANHVGYSTALVMRKECGYHPGFPEPDVMAPNLLETPRAILAHESFPYGKVAPGVGLGLGGAPAYA